MNENKKNNGNSSSFEITDKKKFKGFEQSWHKKNMAQDSYLKARIGWQGLTTAEYLDTGNYILITGTDFKNGKVDWNNCCHVEKKRYDQDKNIQVKPNDILLTKDGSIGKVAYINNVPMPTTLNSGVFVIRPINNSYYPLYFFYVLRSTIFKEFLNKLQAGSTINHLYQKDFVGFSFLAPPIEEQKAIATALSDVDGLIENLAELIAKKKNIKTGTIQQLLTGKKRLKGFETKAGYKNTEIGLIPEDWEVKFLGDLCKIEKGELITEKSRVPGNIPVIAGGLKPSYFHNSANCKVNTITISASGASTGYVSFHNNPIFASDCSTIKSSEKYNVKYIYYLLTNLQIKIYALQTGGAQPHVYPEHMRTLGVIYTDNLKEQKAIANILSDMDAEIEALEQKLVKTKNLKKGMMQELLTGKTRLIKTKN